jgi:hypothetical protein
MWARLPTKHADALCPKLVPALSQACPERHRDMEVIMKQAVSRRFPCCTSGF